ncbi:MAG: TolB family protein [Phototrophicaceae bacterium]
MADINPAPPFTDSMYENYPGIYHRDPIGYFYSAGNTRRLYLGNDNQPYLGPLQWHPSRDYLAFWHMNMKDGERPTFSYKIIEAAMTDFPVSWGPLSTGKGMIAWSPTDVLWVEAFPNPPYFTFTVNRINVLKEPLVTDRFEKRNPTWMPDGTTIGFAYNREDSFDIFTILPDGTELTPITTGETTDEDYPSRSPKGDWLAYLESDIESAQPNYTFAFR